ncbi:hypothetical protein BD769DRAFT_1383979 [Suillus cothurnatus]|nr:hypothetical protein BD769DRAFT_1383979 [Suillus cothurnatus]
MHFSLAIVLAVVASSISATPVDASAEKCPVLCWIDNNCQDCTWGICYFPFCTDRKAERSWDRQRSWRHQNLAENDLETKLLRLWECLGKPVLDDLSQVLVKLYFCFDSPKIETAPVKLNARRTGSI